MTTQLERLICSSVFSSHSIRLYALFIKHSVYFRKLTWVWGVSCQATCHWWPRHSVLENEHHFFELAYIAITFQFLQFKSGLGSKHIAIRCKTTRLRFVIRWLQTTVLYSWWEYVLLLSIGDCHSHLERYGWNTALAVMMKKGSKCSHTIVCVRNYDFFFSCDTRPLEACFMQLQPKMFLC